MKTKSFLQPFITGTFFLLILLCTNAAFAFADSQTISTTTGIANRQGRPDIQGDIITWKRLMGGGSNWDIYYYDLANTGPGAQVVTNRAGMQFNPVTNGADVIWEDWTTGYSDIWMKNVFSTGDPVSLITGTGNQGILGVSGDIAVYVDGNSGSGNIYAVDVNYPSDIIEIVSPSAVPYDQWQPRINGNRIVWQDNRNGDYDIFMKDLSTPEVPERQLTLDPGDDVAPDISGDIVVWKSHHDGQYDIRSTDVSIINNIETPVTDDAAYQESAAVSGDLVVWMDYRNDANPNDTYYDYDIYMKDLTSGQENLLAGGIDIQAYPRLDGERVVWEEYGSSIYKIMMAEVPDNLAPVINSPNPADGSVQVCSSLDIGSEYSDNRSGINASSVRLTIDGQDVTGSATVTDESAYYHSDTMQDGPHTATLAATDMSGNSASVSWTFNVSLPALQLTSKTPFWASFADYLIRELSIRYRITNSSQYADAGSIEILDSTGTAGVYITSATPVSMGGLSPGQQGDVVIRYYVPIGLGSFQVTLYARCHDSCGGSYYFPQAPPGW